MKYFIAFFIFLVLFSQACFPMPNINGTTGLIVIPIADSLKYKEYNLGLDSLLFEAKDTDIESIFIYKANIGLFSNLELGFVGQSYQEGVFINLKYYLASDNSKYPLKTAIGASNLTSYNKTDVYIVASKWFNDLISGHLGFKILVNDNQSITNLMLGLELILQKDTALLFDLIGEGENYMFNTGLRYLINHNLQANLSVLNMASKNTYFGSQDMMISFGIVWIDFL